MEFKFIDQEGKEQAIQYDFSFEDVTEFIVESADEKGNKTYRMKQEFLKDGTPKLVDGKPVFKRVKEVLGKVCNPYPNDKRITTLLTMIAEHAKQSGIDPNCSFEKVDSQYFNMVNSYHAVVIRRSAKTKDGLKATDNLDFFTKLVLNFKESKDEVETLQARYIALMETLLEKQMYAEAGQVGATNKSQGLAVATTLAEKFLKIEPNDSETDSETEAETDSEA